VTPPARGSLVACRDLFQIYRLAGQEVVALQGVDLDVARGELLALLGPSGAGKSTLLALVGGLERPSAGRVWVDGQDLARLPEAGLTAFRRGRVGFVFQTPARNLLPYASAAQNLELPMRLAGVPATRRRERARALLAATGLQTSGSRSVRTLSGGEQQRLAVVVAVANEPPLLLADEPTSQLDRANVARVLELLRVLRDQTGTTVVMVTHDPEAAGAMDRTVSIRGGRVGAEGRGGVEYAVVGPTGLVQLPAPALEVLPPGARALVEVGDGPVLLHPVEPPTEPRDDHGAAAGSRS
jgi:putative ABC transport system ATP-binding protein